MNYRNAIILDAEDASTAGTKTLDLKGMDTLSRLLIELKATNNGSTPTAHPAAAITKIEIVDGSDVLWSLDGYQTQALNFYQRGIPAVDVINWCDNESVVAMMPINFGRWLWDEDYAFDPNRFKNPQLRITHNKALGGSVPDAATLEVAAMTFDELRVAPQGWFMAKEYNKYSLTSSAIQSIDLPTDYVMRMLLIQSLSGGKQPWEQYHDIKLTENNDKRIPINDNTSDLIKYFADYFGTYEEMHRLISTGSDVYFYCAPTYEAHAWGSSCNDDAYYFSAMQGYGGKFYVKCSGAGQFHVNIKGYCPHGVLAIPFGDLWDNTRWYDVTKLAKAQLKITAGSSVGSSSTCQIITEQLRRY